MADVDSPASPASCPTPVPRDGRLGLTVVRRYLVVICLLRPAAAHTWPTLLPPVPLRHRADQLVELSADVARDGLHSRTQCGSWGVRRKLTAGDLAAAPWAATEG